MTPIPLAQVSNGAALFGICSHTHKEENDVNCFLGGHSDDQVSEWSFRKCMSECNVREAIPILSHVDPYIVRVSDLWSGDHTKNICRCAETWIGPTIP